MRRLGCFAAALVLAGFPQLLFAQSQVTRENVEGIRNLAKIESTVACAGAITPESVAQIKGMGYGSIINLRLPTEPNANIEAEAAAAKAAGINFVHIPFNSGSPDAAAVDAFLKAIAVRGNEPAFIHCAGGGRAAAMWFVKRAVLDKWDIERAMTEATALGLTNQNMKNFVTEYVQKRR